MRLSTPALLCVACIAIAEKFMLFYCGMQLLRLMQQMAAAGR
jgi:hypothetical protein